MFNDAKKLIEGYQNIIVLPSEHAQVDSLGAALALSCTLKKMGKNVNLQAGKIAEKFQFLKYEQPGLSKEFVISIEPSGEKIKEMRYEKDGKELKIYLTCEKGAIKEENISFALLEKKLSLTSSKTDGKTANRPELLITLGIKSFEDLEYLNQNTKLLYDTPILNIDNQVSNENFGEVNLINLTSSLSEISTNFIKSIDENIFDENISTPLLAGIIWFSQNFKNPRTRPRAFETASYLIEKGADHQKIIQHFYKTKPISQIKLLGRILEKLIFDETKKLYHLLLTKKDFRETNTTSKDLSFVIKELKFNFEIPRFPWSNLLILWESHGSGKLTKGIFYSSESDFLRRILGNFKGVSQGNKALFIVPESDLELAQRKILSVL